jgi:hypothetical protein
MPTSLALGSPTPIMMGGKLLVGILELGVATDTYLICNISYEGGHFGGHLGFWCDLGHLSYFQ